MNTQPPKSQPSASTANTAQSNAAMHERATRVLVGGVNSPVRAFLSVGGTPHVVASANGSRITDIEGNTYVDYVQSYGASILGHANPDVVAAVQEAATKGTTFGATTLREIELAELIADWVPGVEKIRMTSSGTEAAMSAIRLARGATGRDKVVKFAGCYHGHVDSLLIAGGSGVANQGIVGSPGVPDGAVGDTLVFDYNTLPTLDESVAVVAVEPVAANMGLVEPEPGFLQGLRAECDRVGALLLFDEVITGFRLGQGGATVWSGVQPDVWAFGKVIGGGLPVGVFAGSAEVMANLAPEGVVYQGGTLSGNPLATAAGLAALRQLDAGAYEKLEATAARLATGLAAALGEAGLTVQVPQTGPLLGIFFSDNPVRNYEDSREAAQSPLFAKFFHAMRDRGVALAPGPYEVMFPSLAHSVADVEQTIEIAAAAAEEVVASTEA